MSSKFDIEQAREKLRADYETVHREPFQHFSCPILLKDEAVELCGGHVVNAAFPNSCRTRVLQREDVDNFYGSAVEGHFTTIVNGDHPTVEDLLTNSKLRRVLPWKISVDGETVTSYEPKNQVPPTHSVVSFELGGEHALTLALKISEEELAAAKDVQIVLDRDYVPEAVASLLKAAHLSLFRILGYSYMSSTAGLEAARILRGFYEKYKTTFKSLTPEEQRKAVAHHFGEHMGMIIPLKGFDPNYLNGTIEDRRFILCMGASGLPFALGVLVRTDNCMHAVFLPPSTAENMDTYVDFIQNSDKTRFRYLITRYDPEDGTIEGDPREFEFDPDRK